MPSQTFTDVLPEPSMTQAPPLQLVSLSDPVDDFHSGAGSFVRSPSPLVSTKSREAPPAPSSRMTWMGATPGAPTGPKRSWP